MSWRKQTAFTLSIPLFALTTPCFGDECCCYETDESYVCYTPPFQDLCTERSKSFEADFLYWAARESNLSYALIADALMDPISTTLQYAPEDYEYLETNWKPSFRLGGGWNCFCDGWDSFISWTYMRNTKKNSSSVVPFSNEDIPQPPDFPIPVLVNTWINPSFSFGEFPLIFDKVSAKWNLHLNQIDLEFGRKYWISERFNLRPFGGARFAWITSEFQTTSMRRQQDADGPFANFKDEFTSKTDGYGLLAGFQPTWYMCRSLAFFASGNAALLWQRFSGTKKEEYQATLSPINYSNSNQARFYTMQTVIDLSLGLRFEETFCCNQFRIALDLSWEQHFWLKFNHLHTLSHRFTAADQVTTNYFNHVDRVDTNLMLGGGVVRLRLDF